MALNGPPILLLRALGLGDFLTAVPAYRAIRRAYPGHAITLAAPEPLACLVPLVGAIDRLLPTPRLGALRWSESPPVLAVNLHGRGPESVRDLVGTGAERVLSHRHPDFPAVGGPDWDPGQHEVGRWCRLVEHAGLAADPADLRLAVPAGEPAVPSAVVLHPGASAPARRWPPSRFVTLARILATTGRPVVLTGDPGERALALAIAADAGLPPSSVLAGRLNLTGLAALVAHARLVICGDTGVAHLASAYRTPSVVLFGPSPPAHWGPPPAGPHTVLWAGTTGDAHADVPDPGLLAVTVEQVLDAAFARLRPRPGRSGVWR